MVSAIKIKKTILVVDDAEENLMILDELLKNEYKVICVQSGREAVEILKFQVPDIILLDIVMPFIDGYQTCKIIKADKKTSKIPIIFLSSNSEAEDQLKGFELGAVDYIVKPVNYTLLMAKINTHMKDKEEKDNLQQRIQEKENELDLARLEVIQKLELATEYKDAETGSHINRMSRFCYAIAREYGFNNHKAEILLNAAALHDVGKIGIPDSILLKPGKLSDEEWSIMSKHTEIGARIMNRNSSELLDCAYIVAYQHHEKWNGEGYPLGLKGETIDINARIAAVADVFDALTSDRPYRKAWSTDKAIKYINDEKGKHFDPKVVDAFNNSIDTILSIRNSYNNKSFVNDIIDYVISEI